MYKLTNVSLDPRYAMQRRVAPKMLMEPQIAGKPLRLRSSLVLTDELFAHNRGEIELHRQHGVLVYEQLSQDQPAAPAPPPPVRAAEPPKPATKPDPKPEVKPEPTSEEPTKKLNVPKKAK